MQKFITASVVAAVGLWFYGKSIPFFDSVSSALGSAGFIVNLLGGVIFVLFYRMVSGSISGDGWAKGIVFGLMMFGVSSAVLMAQTGITASLMENLGQGADGEAGLALRNVAISIKDIWAWQGAISWAVIGAVTGAVLTEKKKVA